jgi:ribose-phosphate pyrophosphokinase
VLHKRRLDGAETNVTHVVGEVADRPCLIVDDMISTGGTIEASIKALLAAGARPEISVAATHGLFVQDARSKLSHSGVQNVFVTDSIPLRECQKAWPQLHVISLAPLLTGAIQRIVADGSLGELRELPRQMRAGHEGRTIS